MAVAPHLGGERRAGHHQHAARRRVRCCARRASRRVWCQYCGIASNAPGGVEPARPRQRGARRQRDQHDDADRDPLVVLGMGEGARSTPGAARCPAAGCGRADARARAPAAAGSPAPACARCAAACPPRRGTSAPDAPAAIPARRSSRPPAARRRPAASSPAGRGRASMRIASPASPAAATSVVASTATDPVTSDAPAVAFGATNGVQLSVPRSTSVSDVHCVVTPEDSMKSRNGGLIAAQHAPARPPTTRRPAPRTAATMR